MKLTPAQKSKLLNEAVDLLERANVLQQRAIGKDSDVSFEYHNRIEALVDDMTSDIAEFDSVR